MSEENQFTELGLSAKLVARLEELDFKIATEIQKKTIPSILMGKDIVGISKTGSGKTLAFLLPMIDILLNQPSRHKIPRSLIICPTRELAKQIYDVFRSFDSKNQLDAVLLIGGVNPKAQQKSIVSSVDIVIATPGRLLEFIEAQNLLLTGINFLVLDEADRMLDMGFIDDIKKVLKFLPTNCQNLLFSATLPSDISDIINNLMTSPKKVEIESKHTELSIKQYFHSVTRNNRESILQSMLSENLDQKQIVFCSRKTEVDNLHDNLEKDFGRKTNLLSIHGDVEQSQRQEILNTFKTEPKGILICSDLAARGLDIPLVETVFNFSLPFDVESYVHRIGRTGRAGAFGEAHSLVDLRQDYTVVKGILKLYGSGVIELIDFELEDIDSYDSKRGSKRGYSRGSNRENTRNNSSNHTGRNASRDKYSKSKKYDSKSNSRSDTSQGRYQDDTKQSDQSRNKQNNSSKKPSGKKFDTRPPTARKHLSNNERRSSNNKNQSKVRQFDESNMPDFLKNQ